MSDVPEGWELVCGLEVHCELATVTKLFCGCRNRFGDEANTNVCPVCLGLPGSLPVLNGEAVEYAMKLGRALNCTVNASEFARKNYFYPDMPRDFQVTQFDRPTNTMGYLDLPAGKRIGIVRAHIEEDTGKTSHAGGDGRIHGAEYSLVDYNRAGVPLVEIVSEPDIRSADEAKAYVDELRKIVLAIGVSDAKMEEGSMRVDANVSVRPAGSTEFRTRCEIKNINSLSSIERAIRYEANRHIGLYDAGERPHQETRHWDEENQRTRAGRSKENSDDYRYFPEPDLLPLEPSVADIARIDASLPLLPAARRDRLAGVATVSAERAALIVDRGQDQFAFDAIGAGADPARVLVHIEQNLKDGFGAMGLDEFVRLVAMETQNKLSATQTKQVLAELVAAGGSPEEVAKARGFEAMQSGDLAAIVDKIIAENPDDWQRFVEADNNDANKIYGFFAGLVMKATQGKADGKAVREIFMQRRA
ncbi:MAG: Asp-tRNA(Asn)/Glu-tRNA(Gln) amidotransferase subunit GatB [Acidimicrobiales bacterium]